jgi:chitin disaccharide deacetylase
VRISLLLLAVALAILCGSPTIAQAPVGAKTLAERLGYKATDRLLIIHADDVGMCHSVNAATIRAMEEGVVTCASIMTPCPWLPEIAEYCRSHPEADFGVHLTLTSEWQRYRWRPVTPADQVPGLLDKDGYLPHTVEEVVAHGKPDEVAREIRAQIERARSFGIKPTHVDSHMGTLFTGPFIAAYTREAKAAGILPMLMRATPERVAQSKTLGFDAAKIEETLSQQGYVFLDMLYEDSTGSDLESRRAHYYNLFRNLKPGVTEVIVHLSMDDEEIRHISGAWLRRWNEFQIFTDPKTRELLDSLGIKRIGYKQLAELAYKQ